MKPSFFGGQQPDCHTKLLMVCNLAAVAKNKHVETRKHLSAKTQKRLHKCTVAIVAESEKAINVFNDERNRSDQTRL
ncbi:hypothetical protein SAMN02745165_02926 [Malonomonas rubra DSM 5091]|uniref:Uncharacterized protein n=1 Tax=Malonomonas rubra DSM 5091 TaxID=1122189 RepID=A0A1M6L9V3_MALRU|nr:hypothetical protein [Malonomonas rubra]SHJ67909.1 hypothetical protein SAMN02745165_02926 [Malonomonas rubra DSM 5091]